MSLASPAPALPARPAHPRSRRARLGADRRGAVAVLTGLALVPLLLSAGVAIDLNRASQFRMALQSAADSAALAGAAVYNASADAADATTVADAYMTQAEASLPSNQGVTFTATPTAITDSAGATIGYSVAVSAQATLATTLMSLVVPSLTTAVSASALNPVVTLTAGLGNWKSSAWDANTIYWYVVPTNGSLPAAAALHQLFTDKGKAPSTLPDITVAAGQTIGFALGNVTGGIRGYGPDQYGSAPGHANWFYSQLSPPSANAYPTEPSNCSLQVIVATASDPNPVETPGSCASATPAYATVNCAQLPGQTIYYFWNDMGGPVDDKDYNDAQYSLTCPAPASPSSTVATANPTTVVLTQ